MISEAKRITLEALLDEIIDLRGIIEHVDATFAKYGCHDVDVKETIGRGEPLFVICRKCRREAINTGTGYCVKCNTSEIARSIVGIR
jgi:hypothetical protein